MTQDILHFFARVAALRSTTPRMCRFHQAVLAAVTPEVMIGSVTTSRSQQRYDHRLRELVQHTWDLTIATDLGVPRSTARGWLRTTPTMVVSLEAADLTERELRHEVFKLRRRVQKLAALLRLALVLLRVSGFTLSGERLPRRPGQTADPACYRSGSRLHPAARPPEAPPSVAEC